MNSTRHELPAILPATAARGPFGEFSLAGLRITDLARQYGTPLYVYDALTVEQQAQRLRSGLAQLYPGAFEIAYAAKAYFAPAFARKLADMGLSVDVVSRGELRTARKAGFLARRVHLHGNNKTIDELVDALDWQIESIVVDNEDELHLLAALAEERRQSVAIWLRVSPDILVTTHRSLQTAHAASKFGFSSAGAVEAIRSVHPRLMLRGLHAHLGSQVFAPEPYREAIRRLFALADEAGYWPGTISPGGGWGVPYVPGSGTDDPLPWLQTVSAAVQDGCAERGASLPRLVLEPGRWLVARAAVAVYSAGAVKTAPDGTRIIAVDGGMADNPRPALYGAQYTAFLADRPLAPAAGPARIVGRYCESGDELISTLDVPEIRRGDLLVIPVAGAYQLSMASNYNMTARPAVLWVQDGQVELLQAREELYRSGWWSDAAVRS